DRQRMKSAGQPGAAHDAARAEHQTDLHASRPVSIALLPVYVRTPRAWVLNGWSVLVVFFASVAVVVLEIVEIDVGLGVVAGRALVGPLEVELLVARDLFRLVLVGHRNLTSLGPGGE